MKYIALAAIILMIACNTPRKITVSYHVDKKTGKVSKIVTKYYDEVKVGKEPLPHYFYSNPFPLNNK